VTDIALIEEGSSIIISNASGLVRLRLVEQNDDDQQQQQQQQQQREDGDAVISGDDFEGIGKICIERTYLLRQSTDKEHFLHIALRSFRPPFFSDLNVQCVV